MRLARRALDKQVCAGQMALANSQRRIATDWIAAGHRLVGAWPISARPFHLT
jgi:hypothetical protein